MEEYLMARVVDPVCGMTVDSETAVAQSSHEGRAYYFCSTECKKQFDADPVSYAARAGIPADKKGPLEKHEPPYTVSKGWVSPKFGSAGSGGAEYEKLPEAHDGDGKI
jgi:YHS domain-containing protein